AEGQSGSRDQRRSSRPRYRSNRKGRQHREDRRRQDIRLRSRTGRAHSHGRNRRASAVRGYAMKRLLTLFALVCAFTLAAPAIGNDVAGAGQPILVAQAPATAPAPAAAPEAKPAEPAKPDAGTAPPAPPAAPPPAPTEPQLVAVDKISSGDTAWMLTSTALVLLMTIPGLALFYGGRERKKTVVATLRQSFVI